MAQRPSVLPLLAASIFLHGCAAISSPQGGPRDTVVPTITTSSPPNGSRNVKSQTIRLEFSEQVQLKDLQKNLLIAPLIPEENKYKLREERTAITLVYDKPFDPNTTYTFNFGAAITDITENNPVKDASVTFSTGAVLDSGSVRGTVTNLLTQRPAAEAAVILYPETDTANIRRGKPYYFTRTDKAGAFTLRYLREGRYQLFALVDKNNNNRYDEGEKIAYLPSLYTVGGRADSVRLVLTRPDARGPVGAGQQPGPVQFKVSFNEGLTQASLTPLAGAAPAGLNDVVQLAERGRAVVLYNTPPLTEGRYVLAVTDSVGNASRDTINVRFPGTAPPRRGAAYTVEGSPKEINPQGLLKFQFVEPVRLVPGKPIGTLIEDSTARRPLRIPQEATLNAERTQLTIRMNTKARKAVVVQLDSTALPLITGRPLKLQPVRLRITEQAQTGTLAGTIQTKYKRYWVQLLSQEFERVAELDSPKGTFLFDNLAPGSYRIRVLIDADNDGKWRGGDPQLKLPPEPVYFGPPLQPVRANWDQEGIKLVF